MSVIKVKNLTKDYGNGKGIFNLNFEIDKGDVFGYLGPNGAGKSTTIRHLLGFLKPQSGSCTINSLDCMKDAEKIHSDLGYVSGEIAFFDEMTGVQYLQFDKEIKLMTDTTKMKELIDFFEFDPSGKIKKMSKGMKQKLALITAFMNNPQTVILDEPTSGLDPLMQSRFIDLINKEKSEGKTILMSSHSFDEIEKTCNKVGIIKNGKFVADSTVEDLKKTKVKTFDITFENSADINSFSQSDFKIVSSHGNTLRISVKGEINSLLKCISQYNIISFDNVKQSLEDIFMGYYGGENHD